MNSFIYDIPTKIYFGENQLCHLGAELSVHGKRVLLAYGGGSIKQSGLYDAVMAEIQKAGLVAFELSGIAPNPRVESVREGARICKEQQIDMVLAVGGGSVLDAAKWIAAAACVEHDAWDFFDKWAPVERALPVVTVLTLSATGSEMDCGGVISNPDTKDKIGRMERPLLPRASFLDPTVTYSVSRYQTACGAADMLNHILEVYFTTEQDLYMLDEMMEGLMRTILKFTPTAMAKPTDYEARANLMWASSWAINGFITGGKQHDWSCHPIEHELSALYDITHGLGLAILTPRWLTYCLNEKTLPRYVRFAVQVMGVDAALPSMEIARKGIARLSHFLFDTLELTDTLGALGMRREDLPVMARKACGGGVIHGLMPLDKTDVEKILDMCF